MKNLNIGIFLSLLLMVGLCSCGERKSNTKLVLNEVLIENESNFQDDYGIHSAWIEIFNRSFGSADLAGCLLRVSSQPGDTATYFIPKGDVLTSVKPRQHALFWADGEPIWTGWPVCFLIRRRWRWERLAWIITGMNRSRKSRSNGLYASLSLPEK